ncbi:hypothetical protein HMPREF9318_00066 [Streptococcus urinalis FB127-CNA-2]|uniref:Uncharacterized protein n=1 Tax=Streptococcus urinalis 2285-97 TaxID=764291 RepID=G5KEH2_9STRE|nr:hypothetical protein [Streptococcus urinalis]QBX22130.1 hypothetical protein Javan637_0022 [Streptococcus phage Javan637]QBX31586.1 hypothetical protein Javan642_0022 [Streptococcus phage Javan642]QBX31669.1 hypothetical protein Javan648_0043 [Streptococcus phage Javan648]EHJ56051.1 hypothetical protein STRUR_0806 [Streptococcus urinalis 2285-97]EKS21868.1 hypothetical protein HMPREF9318_00066 [Streptococcus urinalis FB127-CNA-2]
MINELINTYGINKEHAQKIMQLDEHSRKAKLAELSDWLKSPVIKFEVKNG